jgi:hypothetical protein
MAWPQGPFEGFEGPGVQLARPGEVPENAEVPGQVVHGNQRAGMVRPHGPFASFDGLGVQVAGRGVVPEALQVRSQVVSGN